MQLKLEPASPIPMYLQIVEQIRHGIATGSLRAGDELPSVRALALEHLINPNTVARAYLELEHAGLVAKRRGAGTYVA
jgi:GntR family transcriptional regulator